MAEEKIVTIMSAFFLIEDKFDAIRAICNAKIIDTNTIDSYANIIEHLFMYVDTTYDVDLVAREMVSIFGPYMQHYNQNSETVETLYDSIKDATIDIISENGIVVRNQFLERLKFYGCKPIADLNDDEFQQLVNIVNERS